MYTQSSSITPKHVYTILNENRSGMKDYILHIFNINKTGELNQSEIVDDSSFNLSNISTTENITFSLVISNDVWKDIKLIRKIIRHILLSVCGQPLSTDIFCSSVC